MRLVSIVLFSTLAASGVQAALVVHTSEFIATPVAYTGFEAGIPIFQPQNVAYIDGGISVTRVSPFNGAELLFPLNGSRGWYALNQGFTSIRLETSGAFNQIGFRAATGLIGDLQYNLLLNGNSVATGVAGSLPDLPTSRYLGFSGISFDEVRLQNRVLPGAPFDPDGSEALNIDDIAIGVASNSAVPEPDTWAMFIFGFVALGLVARRNRQSFAMLQR